MAMVRYGEGDPAVIFALEKYLGIFLNAIVSDKIGFQPIRRYTGDGFVGARWGAGVFAKEKVSKGEVIEELHGHLRSIPKESGNVNRYSVIALDGKKDKLLTGPSSFINHHCTEFNVVYNLLQGQQTLNFLAVKDIDKGEEFFVNYGPHYFAEGTCQCSFHLQKLDTTQLCAKIVDDIFDKMTQKQKYMLD